VRELYRLLRQADDPWYMAAAMTLVAYASDSVAEAKYATMEYLLDPVAMSGDDE
jgi:hypothetical protein